MKRLRAKYDRKSGTLDKFPDNYFQMNHGTIRVVLAFLPGKVTNVGGNQRLSEAALKIIDDLDPKKYAPDLRVGLGGDVQNVVEENRELVKGPREELRGRHVPRDARDLGLLRHLRLRGGALFHAVRGRMPHLRRELLPGGLPQREHGLPSARS